VADEDARPVPRTGRAVGPGHRRAVPPRLGDEARERLRWLLHDPDHWVLRTGWERYLATGDEGLLVHTDALTQDQRIAAAAWLRQQQHALYRALEGEDRAPEGWLDDLPMVRAFLDRREPTDDLTSVPRQPGGPLPAIGERADLGGAGR
jgi:hypothetical protein